MSATDELRFCPFCGSKANVLESWLPDPYVPQYGVGCSNPDCRAYTGYGMKLHRVRQDAIDEWNRRDYGPTRRHPMPYEKWTTVLLSEIAWPSDGTWPDSLSVALDIDGEWRVYVPEAMLERDECDDIGTDRFVCSKCGCTLDIEDAASCEPTMWVDGEAACPRFCPNCGRKVRQ